jgi:hypothetical protein
MLRRAIEWSIRAHAGGFSLPRDRLMGAEATCVAHFNGATARGKARLETDVLQFRAAGLRLTIPFAQITTIAARGDALTIAFADGTATLDLGAAATKWAEKIRNPPSRLDKLGVKRDQSVALVNLDDEVLVRDLESAGAVIAGGQRTKGLDVIVCGASRENDLDRLERLKTRLQPTGALWVIRPKGRPEISEQSVRAAGRGAGLVDVKVVSFSSTHTAHKFVIPLAGRRPARTAHPSTGSG